MRPFSHLAVTTVTTLVYSLADRIRRCISPAASSSASVGRITWRCSSRDHATTTMMTSSVRGCSRRRWRQSTQNESSSFGQRDCSHAWRRSLTHVLMRGVFSAFVRREEPCSQSSSNLAHESEWKSVEQIYYSRPTIRQWLNCAVDFRKPALSYKGKRVFRYDPALAAAACTWTSFQTSSALRLFVLVAFSAVRI